MTRRTKWVLSVTAAAVLIYLVPIIVMAISTRGFKGYFIGGKCMGGHEIFTYFRGDGYYTYCPGHRKDQRKYTLRSVNGEWEALNEKGTIVCRLRVQDGDVYWQGRGRIDWWKLERINSPWRLWIPRLLPQ